MEKQILKEKELEKLGFKFKSKCELDAGYYMWYQLAKNDSQIDITYVFRDQKLEKTLVEINGQDLKGRPITAADIKLLIEIL